MILFQKEIKLRLLFFHFSEKNVLTRASLRHFRIYGNMICHKKAKNA